MGFQLYWKVIMVPSIQICCFSGLKIHPGHGILFIRSDGQQLIFSGSKTRSLYGNQIRPMKIAWTAACRKAHKKDQTMAFVKKKKTKSKVTIRSYASASAEVIHSKQKKCYA